MNQKGPNKVLLNGFPWVLEVFVISNLAFLAVDIFLAHSVNRFFHPAEWIPFWFSAVSPLFLVTACLRGPRDSSGRGRVGILVGSLAIVVGISGFILHLEAAFFSEQTLKSLVYTAPFAAPLAYAGLGMLLLVNRLERDAPLAWSQWVVFLALGGFVGNLALSLCDHAQNGFFIASEWIPVVAAAFGVSFLTVLLFRSAEPALQDACIGLMCLESIVGILGFFLHGKGDLADLNGNLWFHFVHGAPIFAPLLFSNLAILAILGIVGLRIFSRECSPDEPIPDSD